MKKEVNIAVICHLFYTDIALQLLQKLTCFNKYNVTFYINIQGNSSEYKKLNEFISLYLNNALVLNTPNKGRDIGPKLFLINLMNLLENDHEYSLIIHDKKSEHIKSGTLWRNELFKIIEEKNLPFIFKKFELNENVGAIGAAKFIQNEYVPEKNNFLCTSSDQIKVILKKYNIHTRNYDFVAGNIFWIRADLLKRFFSKRSILAIRSELESGNSLDFGDGTYIHAWERIMSWIATSQGYKIYGI